MARYMPKGAKVGEYPSSIIKQATLDRLSVVAHLHNTPYADPRDCSVLEIGCSVGGHIINMAITHPNSHFVGIDLNEEELNLAKEKADKLGLENIELWCTDATTWETDVRFDYIIIHGVVSWIENDIADKMLQQAMNLLSDKGLLYVSHLCWPKDFIQEIIRECFWLTYDSKLEEFENVMNGKNIAKMVLEAWKFSKNPMHDALRRQLEFLDAVPNSYIFHEYVCPRRTFRVHQLCEIMPILQYVCDADISPNGNMYEMESEFIRNMWPTLPSDKLVRLCDSMYFIGFRSSVFTKAKCKPQYDTERWKELYATRSLLQRRPENTWFEGWMEQTYHQVKVTSLPKNEWEWGIDTPICLIKALKSGLMLFSTYIREADDWKIPVRAWVASVENNISLFYSGRRDHPLGDQFGQDVPVTDAQARWLYWSLKDPAKRKAKMINEMMLNKFEAYQNLSFFQAQQLAESMEKKFPIMFAKVGFFV